MGYDAAVQLLWKQLHMVGHGSSGYNLRCRAPRAVRQRRKPVDAVLNASPIVPGRCLRHPLPLAQHEIRDDILLAASLFVAPYAYNQHACAFGRRWCHRSDRTEPRD